MHTAWLAVLYTCATIYALSLTVIALVIADLAAGVHRARRPVTDEEIAAALRDWAGEAL